jgi:hypothetical protein
MRIDKSGQYEFVIAIYFPGIRIAGNQAVIARRDDTTVVVEYQSTELFDFPARSRRIGGNRMQNSVGIGRDAQADRNEKNWSYH